MDKRDDYGDVIDDDVDEGPTPAKTAKSDNDPARVNNLNLGAGQPADVRYPHQVDEPVDADAANPQAVAEERVEDDRRSAKMRRSEKSDADTRATETPGEKR